MGHVTELTLPLFQSSDRLFESSDCDALRDWAEVREFTQLRTVAEPLKENILALLDNLSLTCLMRFVKPILSINSKKGVTTGTV